MRRKEETGGGHEIAGRHAAPTVVTDPALAPEINPRIVYMSVQTIVLMIRPLTARSSAAINDNPGKPLGLYRAPPISIRRGRPPRRALWCRQDVPGGDRCIVLTLQYNITFTQAVKKKHPGNFAAGIISTMICACCQTNTGKPASSFSWQQGVLPLFCRLTQAIRAPKTVFYKSALRPSFPGIIPVRFTPT